MAFLDTMQAKMESSLVPLAAKLNEQRHMVTVRDAFTLAGSLITVLNNAVLSPNEFIAQILHLDALIPNLADYQKIFVPILYGTTNVLSILSVLLTAYKLAETREGDKILAAVCAVGTYFFTYPAYAVRIQEMPSP